MLEFLLGYWLGHRNTSEPERPRYFRESPQREETKEEKRESERSLSRRSMYACNWHTNYLSRYWLPTVRCTKSFTLTIINENDSQNRHN